MMIRFDIGDYRDIQRVCGVLSASCVSDYKVWCHLHLIVHENTCDVYGSNGIQIARMRVECTTTDVPYGFEFLLKPIKPVYHARTVEIYIDEVAKNYSVIFVDSEDEIIDTVTEPICDEAPIDFISFYQKAQDHFDTFGVDGTGKYAIAVNPKVLMRSLEGLKTYDKVIMNFGDTIHPFRIFPYENLQDIECLVYPMRL